VSLFSLDGSIVTHPVSSTASYLCQELGLLDIILHIDNLSSALYFPISPGVALTRVITYSAGCI
jgi:hypothetical protein